jgi:maleamate amidohydrolase
MSRSIFELIPGLPEEDQQALRKMWGGEVQNRWGLGDRPAVLVVDMTRAFVEDRFPTGWEATGRPCAAAIAQLLPVARAAGLPVFYTVTEPADLEVQVGAWLRGRPGPSMFPFDGPLEAHEIVPELKPEVSDVVYVKEKPSAFFASPLTSMLTYLRVDSVIVTGMTTSGCVRATVNDAFSYNYRVTVPVECVADRSQLSHRVELLDMGSKYADLVALEDLLEEID